LSDKLDGRILELLSARICHELAGPVSAIVNGVELMSEDDSAFAADALRLVGTSARSASRRLQFYRFAYGTLPGEGTPVSTGRDLTLKFFEGGNVLCDWPDAEATRSFAWQRLAGGLLVLAAEALPRGGTVSLRGRGNGISIDADGDTVRLLPEAQAALQPDLATENLTPRGVHAYMCRHFATALNLKIAPPRAEPRRLRIEAGPA